MSSSKLTYGFTLLAAIVLQSCGASSDSETVQLRTCSAALRADQGVGLQGFGYQGFGHQGFGYQGVGFQGFGFQGLGMQGLGYQGFGMQGFGMQGIGWQGIGWQGIGWQGIGWQGFGRQGIDYQGVGWQGVGWQGVGWQGTGLDGETGPTIEFRGVDVPGVASDIRPQPMELIVSVELRNGQLVATTETDRELAGAELRGLHLPFVTTEGEIVWVQLTDAAMADDHEDLWLYTLKYEGQNICDDDAEGVFVPGVWDATGAHVEQATVGEHQLDATFSCPAGVIAKCVLWGYRPSTVGADLHQACTRMARADYCGDGQAHTENGTLIDMYDREAIQTTVSSPDLSFEAGWGANGAVCVNEPRYVDVGPDGDLLLPSCWDSKPHCDTWEEALELGADLGNDSSHTLRISSCGTE